MEIFIIIALILLNGVLAMTEVSFINARRSQLMAEAKRGSTLAEKTLKLIEEPDKFLSTVQVGITLIGLLTGLYSGATIADDFANILVKWGVGLSVAHGLAQAIIVAIVTYVSIVFGELVPKRIGMAASERVSKIMYGPMTFLSWITTPFVWILSKTTSLVADLLRISDVESKVTEEAIKSMIAEGAEDGEVQEVEQDIVERVFSLGDRKISSIMTSRTDIVWIDKNLSNAEIYDIIKGNIYDIYPVGDDSLDNIVGVVAFKDLFLHLDEENFDIATVIQQPNCLHENTDVYKVLEQMRDYSLQYGLIFDEFGVFQGIVTHKDLLEGLIGSIWDEEEGPDIIRRKESDEWIVDGQTPFYEFLSHFDREELFSDDFDFSTIGGLVLEILQHIPKAGESVEWNGFKLEVVDMDGARIDKILVKQENKNIID